jgi:hypothetical protein
VVETPENAAMVLALAHIFEHGVDGRFFSQVPKYHHEGGRVYWSTIVKEVEAIGPTLVERREEAEKAAAIERERRAAQWREYERQEEARRQAEAHKASRQQLLAIVDDWSLARSIESFFEDAERRASTQRPWRC